jgi:hypothetical protein
MKVHVRDSIQSDVDYLASNLREEDRLEVLSSHGDVKKALQDALDYSEECYTIIVTDTNEIAGMYGLCEMEDMVASPWLLTSPAIRKVWLPFLRQSKQWVADANLKYPVLTNACDERYHVALKWLRFVGFTFIKRHETYGEGNKPFLEFVRI